MWSQSWPTIAMANMERSLVELAGLIERPPRDQSDEVSAAMARFLVIRSCGYLEQVVAECCRAYLTSKSEGRVSSFASSHLRRGMNPAPEKLAELVRRFDPNWARELEELLKEEDDLLQRELAMLVDKRNKIAHGVSEGIGARKALDLYNVAREIADWFILRIAPT